MMQKFTIYNGTNELKVQSTTNLSSIIKIRVIKEVLFLLNNHHQLFIGHQSDKSDQSIIILNLLRTDVVDIDSQNDEIYLVQLNGLIYKTTVTSYDAIRDPENEWREIIVPHSIQCPHGFVSQSEKVKILRINCNNDGMLFISRSKELYGMGDFGAVSKTIVPTRIDCFTGYRIQQVCTGEHFVVVLAYKRPLHDIEDDSIEDGEQENSFLVDECVECRQNSIDNKTTYSEHIDDVTEHNGADENTDSYESNRLKSLLDSFPVDNIMDTANGLSSMVDSIKSYMTPDDQMNRSQCDSVHENSISSLQDVSEIGGASICDDNLSIISEFTEFGDCMTGEQYDCNVERRKSKLDRYGASLLGTSVWCFGSINRGHLGTGDHIKRSKVNVILGISGQGVFKIDCGAEHSLALTLDGRLYLWGSNTHNQISTAAIEDYSSPQLYNCQVNVLDASCGQNCTYAVLNDLEIKELRKPSDSDLKNEQVTPKLFTYSEMDTNDETLGRERKNSTITFRNPDTFVPRIISDQQFYLHNFSQTNQIFDMNYFTREQCFLRDLLDATRKIVKPLTKKLYILNAKCKIMDQLCEQFIKILNLTAVNVRSMVDFYCGRSVGDDVAIIRYVTEYASVYRLYLSYYCSAMCSKEYRSLNVKVDIAFFKPFHHILDYIDFIGLYLPKINETFQSKLEQAKSIWLQIKNDVNVGIELAERTKQFWDSTGKALTATHQLAERRVVLDSKTIPLKLMSAGRFSTHLFVLFSDIFCHHSGGMTICVPLSTVWVSSISDKDSRKNAIRIETPEQTYVLLTGKHSDKMTWLKAIERSILTTIGRSTSSKVPQLRYANYEFSKNHDRFPNAKYFGCWYKGKMHGIGRLEYNDEREYVGQMINGDINGFGRLIVPNLSSYEGEFTNGKYNGYGMLEWMGGNHAVYDGHFVAGRYSGHGILRSDELTYIGDFVNGEMDGYGVLDDNLSGDKYMGRFSINKRNGHGIMITMDCVYYEGTFVNGAVDGNGVAVFENGQYYEGEMNILGPTGKGVYYMPHIQRQSENPSIAEMNVTKCDGIILSGQLSGTWSDVKVDNGQVLLNQNFNKLPSNLGLIRHHEKWRSLFSNWELTTFGDTISKHHNDRTFIWNKIAVFMTNSKRIDSIKVDIFSTMENKKPWKLSSSSLQNGLSHGLSRNNSFRHLVDEFEKFATDTNLTNGSGPSLTETFRLKKDFAQQLHDETAKAFTDTKLIKQSSLEVIPDFGINKLTLDDLGKIKNYLSEAFSNPHHPLCVLNNKISHCFYTSYGCWKVKPSSILSEQAMREWESISERIYKIIVRMFPALPSKHGSIDGENISHFSLLYPILLSEGIYSTLFVLYASKSSVNDEIYRQRILICDKKEDEELAVLLKIESNLIPIINIDCFKDVIASLKLVKEKYCPNGMIKQIEQTFHFIESAKTRILGKNSLLNADNIVPLTIYAVLRAAIPHFGAEILLLEDLMGTDYESIMSGYAGYCFTTLKIAYHYIISDKFLKE